MKVVYRDGGGYVLVEVDQYGIAFFDGKAYFSDANDTQYRIPYDDLVRIGEEEQA